jgi:phospholipase/carboxylesterase
MSRRKALGLLGRLIGAGALAGCLGNGVEPGSQDGPHLSARPASPTVEGATGKSAFADPAVHGVVYVPSTTTRDTATPLVVFLHGALRTVDYFVDGLAPGAESSGVIVLAPYAAVDTWDAIHGAFGPDIAGIDAALRWVFARWQIDAARIVLSGFSDGGTYGLAVGRANGDLFARVVAYSPGFLIGITPEGRPPILITHGTQDTVLPIDQTSRVIVPELRRDGYDVDYREFVGPHAVPLEVANEVMADLTGSPS